MSLIGAGPGFQVLADGLQRQEPWSLTLNPLAMANHYLAP